MRRVVWTDFLAAMSTALRRTGVNVLGDVPWGAHICIFYEFER